MAMPDFFPSGRLPNPAALFTNVLLLNELRYDVAAPGTAQYLRITGATELYQDRTTGVLPPFVQLLKEGTEYLLLIDGTSNADQTINYIVGAVNPLRDHFANVLVDAAWLRAWRLMRPRFLENFDLASATRLRISGHSMGAAIGLVAAVEMASHKPDLRVEVMNFGTPRTYEVGFVPPPNLVHLRVNTTQDPIQHLPYAETPTFTFLLAQVAQIGHPRRVNFAHYGSQFFLGDNGAVFASNTLLPNPVGYISLLRSFHFHDLVEAYLWRASLHYTSASFHRDFVELIPIARALYERRIATPIGPFYDNLNETMINQVFALPPPPPPPPAPQPPAPPAVGDPFLVELLFGLDEPAIEVSSLTDVDGDEEAPTLTLENLHGLLLGLESSPSGTTPSEGGGASAGRRVRKFWLMRGTDRLLLEKLQRCLAAIATRDGLAVDPPPTSSLSTRTTIVDWDDDTQAGAFEVLMTRATLLLAMTRRSSAAAAGGT
jgi:Lipase (class 3)